MIGTYGKLKRALAMLLGILMLVTALPVSAFAEVLDSSGQVVAADTPATEQESEKPETDDAEPTATPEAEASAEPARNAATSPTAVPQADYVFPRARVKLADVMNAVGLKLGNNYKLSVDTDAVTLTWISSNTAWTTRTPTIRTIPR